MSTATAAVTSSETTGIYAGRANRDGRIDILRGVAIVLLATEVVTHLANTANTAFESTTTVSGVAVVLLLEGALIGMRERPRVAAGTLGESALRIWTQARNWYLTVVAFTVIALLARFIPGIDTHTISAQSVDTDDLPSLFAPGPLGASGIVLDYPLNPQVIVDTLFLRFGPWPLDVLSVALIPLLTAPLVLLAISKRRWWIAITVSSAVYFLELFTSLRVLPTRAEESLPVLGWQAVFVVGLIAGYYRRELMNWFRSGLGLMFYLVVTVSTVVWLMLPVAISVIGVVPPDVLLSVAGPHSGWLFEPSAPGPLRVAMALSLVVAGYGLLTALWRPLNAALGWLLEPLGSEVLTSLVTLVVAGVAISSVPNVPASPLVTTLVTLAVIAVMWGAAQLRSARRASVSSS